MAAGTGSVVGGAGAGRDLPGGGEPSGDGSGGDATILTVPDVLDEVVPVQPTGSPWVALPDLDVADGSVPSLTVLHERAGGLLEVTGDPLVGVTARVDGRPVPREAWTLEVIDGLLPRWSAEADGLVLQLTIACPPAQRGVVVEVVARRPQQDGEGATRDEGRVTTVGPRTVELEVGGRLTGAALHVFSGRPLAGPHRWRFDPWSKALVWELAAGLPVLGLAVRSGDGAAPELDHREMHGEGSAGGGPGGGDEPSTADASPLTEGPGLGPRWTHRRTLELAPGQTGELVVLLGIGREADSASLATVDLARRGAAASIAATRAWYADRCGPDLGADRAALQAVRDRNRLFCLIFAAGLTIDTDELVLVTSRSPRYYVSGAHWTRDSLLWAYPAVLAVDPEEAARWLRVALTRYTRHPGDHALSITGGSLYPGFELDQVCAFHLAIDALLAVDPDAVTALLAEPMAAAGLARVDAALDGAWDTTTGLYATFLLSSDDPAPLPFVTWSNGLAVAALRARARRRRHLAAHRPAAHAAGAPDRRDALQDEGAVAALLAAIDRHLVIEGPFGPMFAGAGDGHGTHVRFDEPPGSLELLAHHGVVDEDDPRWRATVTWIHSDHNPYGPGPGRFATPTCAHASHPWLLAIGNALLRGEDRWLDLLPEMPLDQGLACETADADTGRPRTGLAFATCAGWLAHAIDVATARQSGPAGGTDLEDPS